MSIYTIVYNDKKPKNRIRFTLAHEFGHIVLQHLSDKRTEIDRGGLPDAVYYAYEGSANTFAGNFLVPPIILYEKLANRVFNTQAIASAFKISEEAVRDYRHDDFLHWQTLKPMLEEVEILARFKKRLYTFFCTTCASIFSIKGAKYCPICGESAVPIRLGDDETMGKIYSGVQLLEDGRVKECLVCKNEEHMEGARYCMVCGKHVINQCSFALTDPDYVDRYADQCQHREPLPGNARYCPYCGSETTFFQSKILPPWGQNDGDEMPF